jgi:hypothetical protein
MNGSFRRSPLAHSAGISAMSLKTARTTKERRVKPKGFDAVASSGHGEIRPRISRRLQTFGQVDYLPLLCLRKAIRSRRSVGLETRKSISLPGIEASGSVSHLSSDCSSQTICDFFSAAEYA